MGAGGDKETTGRIRRETARHRFKRCRIVSPFEFASAPPNIMTAGDSAPGRALSIRTSVHASLGEQAS